MIDDDIITNLILFVHDKGHATIDSTILDFIRDYSEPILVPLWRGVRLGDGSRPLLSYTESQKVALMHSRIGVVVPCTASRGFNLYRFLLRELSPRELIDIRKLLLLEKEWLVVQEN